MSIIGKAKQFSDLISIVKNILPILASLGLPSLAIVFHVNYIYVVIATECVILLTIAYAYNHRFTLRKTFFKSKLKPLTERGITFDRIDYAESKGGWFFKKNVFWPVVPSKNLSIIHLAFVNCLQYLMKNGFDVHVLIYDLHYKGRVRNEQHVTNTNTLEEDVKYFVGRLKTIGLRSSLMTKVSYKYESSSMGNKFHRFYSCVCSEISVDQLTDIGSEKLHQCGDKPEYGNKPVLRFVKPLSIIAYLLRRENREFPPANIAMTLCGADEIKLYTHCYEIMRNHTKQGYVPCQVFIPQFYRFDRPDEPLGVMDQDYSIRPYNKSDLKSLAASHPFNSLNPNDPILFLFNHVLFQIDSKNARFNPQCHNLDTDFSWSEFVHKCSDQKCPDIGSCIIEGIFNRYLNDNNEKGTD